MIPIRLTVFCLLFASGAWSDMNAPLKEIFTTKLLKELGASGNNVIFSPASLDTALSIVALGARGQTQNEFYTSLGYDPQGAKEAITEKQKKLNETPAPGAIWQSANRIMAAPDLPIKPDYLTEVTQTFPGVVVNNFNFDNPQQTANEVNSWVADKTKNVIKELLDPGSIDPNTRMIVLNAVYFKGEWKHGFDKKRTKMECFYSQPDKCEMTSMMHIKEDFKYGYHDNLKAQIIELPYKNEDFSMVVVLPDDKKQSNLTTLLANLNVDEVLNFIDERKWPVEVHVTLPKFEIEFMKEMKGPLINLGIRNAFSDSSDLSGMIAGLRARVDSVVHKAKITCDEEGTVAAAATGIQIVPLSLIIKPDIYFVANKPFLFIVRNKKSGSLFAGIRRFVNRSHFY